MSKENTAVFIGHSETDGLPHTLLKELITNLIADGITDFLNGGQGEFDRICALYVHNMQKEFKQVKNYLIIPYLTFKVFNAELFDEIIYPDGFEHYHFKAAIPARNRYMVENASYAVYFVNHDWGGAAKTYEWAKKRNLKIYNLGNLK